MLERLQLEAEQELAALMQASSDAEAQAAAAAKALARSTISEPQVRVAHSILCEDSSTTIAPRTATHLGWTNSTALCPIAAGAVRPCA